MDNCIISANARVPDAPWRPINELPESDDLFWFLGQIRENDCVVDGPRPPQSGGYDADEWDYFCPAESPPFRAASGGDSASLEQRARDAFEEWFAAVEAGDGTIPVPQSIADGQAWHEHIGRRQMAQGAWFEAIRFAALANQQGVGDQ